VTYLSLRQWRGQFGSDKVIIQIRRKIQGRIADGGCVVVLDDSAQGLTPAVGAALAEGWPSGKVLFSRTHPESGGRLIRYRRPKRCNQ
jgi:hypothetical protein